MRDIVEQQKKYRSDRESVVKEVISTFEDGTVFISYNLRDLLLSKGYDYSISELGAILKQSDKFGISRVGTTNRITNAIFGEPESCRYTIYAKGNYSSIPSKVTYMIYEAKDAKEVTNSIQTMTSNNNTFAFKVTVEPISIAGIKRDN